MSIVLDASMALAWCFADEARDTDVRLLDRLRGETIDVPALWRLEIANVLALAERRGRITAVDIATFLDLLSALEVNIDVQTSDRAFTEIFGLARSHALTAYDAAYLELAMRLGGALASKDQALCKAAERLGVVVVAA
ncbi:MAG TPA: type II toxin-antitoxin system VapC family toxin [Rhodospirillales bacterium]|nr:type II toxin-antitoxin system VapC family toxin [Rhodospirillales bacterium]